MSRNDNRQELASSKFRKKLNSCNKECLRSAPLVAIIRKQMSEKLRKSTFLYSLSIAMAAGLAGLGLQNSQSQVLDDVGCMCNSCRVDRCELCFANLILLLTY